MSTQGFAGHTEAPDALTLCRRLIAAPSENPPGDETQVANLAAEILAAAGYELEWFAAEAHRPNLLARMKRGAGPRLIFQAHSDTKPAVAPGASSLWSVDPFQPTFIGDRLYGLGSCDTKGGLAAQLAAACAVARDTTWSGELIVQAVADEEDGSRLGAEHLLNLGLLEADGAIVAEPTGCLPSLAQLGNAWAQITVTGRAAHAGHPEQGTDAFRVALSYIACLEKLVEQLRRDTEFPRHPRLNVGYASVPGHPGTMPGECVLRCDIRVLPNVERDDVLALYMDAAAAVERDCGASIAVERYQGGGCQSHGVAPTHRLAEACFAAQRETRQQVRTLAFAGGTDARYFGAAGTPAIVYGPGSLEQAHAPDEYVPVAEVQLAQRQLTHIALKFLNGQPL
jgi:succinyl-diaminopimelate desuccinylase